MTTRKKDPAPTKTTPASAPGTPLSLDELAESAGRTDATLDALLFRHVSEPTLLVHGKRLDSGDILFSIPRFVTSVRAIYDGLPVDKRKLLVGYTPTLDAVLLREAVALQSKKARHDGGTAGGDQSRASSRSAAKRTYQHAVQLRQQVAHRLHPIVSDDQRAELDEALARVETASEVATGLATVARVLRALLAASTPDEVAVLAAMQLGAAQADALDAAGKDAVAAEKRVAGAGDAAARVTQRELDLQDGRVLHVAGLIYGAFRDANHHDPTILLPETGRMAPVLASRPKHAPRAAGDGASGSEPAASGGTGGSGTQDAPHSTG